MPIYVPRPGILASAIQLPKDGLRVILSEGSIYQAINFLVGCGPLALR